MFAAWLFGYLIAFAVIGNLVLAQHPPKIFIYLLCVMFIPGLFAALGIGIVHEKIRPIKGPFLAAGLSLGFVMFRSWLLFILFIVVGGSVLFLFSSRW